MNLFESRSNHAMRLALEPDRIIGVRERSKTRILVVTEHVNATYFLSFHFPMQVLATSNTMSMSAFSQHKIESGYDANGGRYFDELFSTISPDLVVFSRCSTASSLELVKRAAKLGIGTIYHIDDDLLGIVDHLGKAVGQTHGRSEVVEMRRLLMTSVDFVYASTSELKSRLENRLPGTRVESGEIYAPYMAELVGPVPDDRVLHTVGYMGSKGHQADLELVAPALESLLQEDPDLRFETFGTVKMPDRLKRFAGRVESYSVQKDYKGFLGHLAALRWSAGLAPLVDNEFNRCRAPTKFIEYSACGIYTIASRMPVYSPYLHQSRGRLAGDDEWYESIRGSIYNREELIRGSQNAALFCRDRFSLERLSDQLSRVLGLAL